MHLAAQGDQRAFARFYDLVAPRILGLVRRCLIDHHQSEEVTQEVFLELWRTATSFDPAKGRAITWALTIAHRRAIDRVRASQSSRNRDLAVGIRDREIEYDRVSEHVEISLEHGRALDAMNRLSAIQREAIELAYVEGATQNEIAMRLGIPVGTVKTRIRDGLASLRGHMIA